MGLADYRETRYVYRTVGWKEKWERGHLGGKVLVVEEANAQVYVDEVMR
jgi:hypothetical protein